MSLGMILLVLLCLLAFTTSTSAEGVWVLWSESWSSDSNRTDADTKWEVLAATPSPEVRESVRRDWIGRYRLVAQGNGIFSGKAEGPANTFRPVCLPDTKDPRGPKGK
jgi:hypothetical protein